MASPIIDLLEGPARAVLPFITQGVAEGLSSGAIIEHLNVLGATFRRTDMLSVIRHVRASTSAGLDPLLAAEAPESALGTEPRRGASYVANLRRDRLPTVDRLEQSATFTKGRYSYLVEIRGNDIFTGDPGLRYVSVATDELLSKADAVDAAAGLIEDTNSSGAITFDDALVVNITINPLFA